MTYFILKKLLNLLFEKSKIYLRFGLKIIYVK